MTCKVCEKGTMIKEGNKYVCEKCGAIAVSAESAEDIKKIKADAKKAKKEAKRKKQEEAEARKSTGRKVLDFFLPIVIALVVATLLKTFVFANAVVPTGSMLQTIQENDRVIASRLTYEFNDPERGDIIIFKYPDDYARGVTTYFVKRIIALPGETITITGGSVYITDVNGNTQMLEEDYVVGTTTEGWLENGTYTVPEDCYFVMGDNRENSEDSRYWSTTHCVERDLIEGKVMFKYYPKFERLD
ncbi:MAG: signal peptidase I [Eubacterium sp.]